MLWKEVLTTVLFCIILCLGLLGNSIIIYIYGVQKRRNQRFLKFERLMLILGSSDLLSTFTNTIMYLYLTIHGYKNWKFGIIGCKILPMIGPTLSNFSLGIILIVTIDRDRAIVRPLANQFELSTIYIAAFVSLLLSILALLPYGYYIDMYNGVCRLNSDNNYSLILNVVILVVSDAIFIAIFTVTTKRIICSLNNTRTRTISTMASRRTISLDSRRKSTYRICYVIVGMGLVFITFIFPRDIYLTIYYTSKLVPPQLLTRQQHEFVLGLVKLLHTANSSVNVVIYLLANKTFRKEVLVLLKRISCRVIWSNEISMESSITTK